MRKAEKKDVYETAPALLEKDVISNSGVGAPLLRAPQMTHAERLFCLNRLRKGANIG